MQAATAQFRRGKYLADAYEKRVERFWLVLGVAPSGRQVVHPSPTVPPPSAPAIPPPAVSPAPAPPPTASLTDRLRGLAKLHADGILTDEEFAAAKRRALEI